MINGINKSAKRVLSIVLALVMLVGTLFTANITINVDAQALSVVYWDGSFDSQLAGSGTAEDPYKITNAAEFAAVAKGQVSTSAHYKVEGVSAFYLLPSDSATTLDSFSTINDINSFLSYINIQWPTGATFSGTLDGNGATIYGLYINGSAVSGLFSTANGATIKNLGIEKSYINTSGNAGAFFGQGNWGVPDEASYSPMVTIENCVVRDCTIMGGTRGAFIGNSGRSGLTINNCLAADNFIGAYNAVTADAYPAFVSSSDAQTQHGVNVPTTISNSIGIGIIPKAGDVNTYSHKKVINCYSTHSMSYSVENVQLTSKLSVSSLQGTSAKLTAATFNWATDTENGAGYWHVIDGDYPTPIKPEGWQDIVVHPVWSGNAAESFAGGTGTEEDPYIIETPDQLFKMVMSGGRELTGKTKTVKLTVGVTDTNGNMLDNAGAITTDATKQAYKYSDQTVEVPEYRTCYYKVADGVSDLYLNNVQGGNLDTLKALVSAGTAKNWNKNYDAAKEKADSDGDGFFDEGSAFRGVFDGNGVTIHGLYTTKGISTSWLAYGDGFFPAIKGDAVVKNVTFDKAYINPSSGYGGVVSSSIGLDATNNNSEGNNNKGILSDNCTTTNATFANVSVRNAYVAKGGYSTQSGLAGAYSKGGLMAAHGSPKTLSFINCLFDGDSSELLYDTNDYTAGIFMTTTTASSVTMVNCVSIGVQPLTCSLQVSKANLFNCYTDTAIKNDYNKDDAVILLENGYDSIEKLPLLNWGIWSINTVENDRKLPMPGITDSVITGYGSIKDMVLEQVGGAGNFSYSEFYEKGTYGHYDKLTGSGTEQDPYLISTPLQLANAIATGGVNLTNKLYYKLTCDINLGSIAWIDQEPVYNKEWDYNKYKYVPFQGTLDGNGYTIYELNATDENSGALIPELNGGTIKNLHIRNSAGNAAIFAVGSGIVENCSAIDCYVANGGALVSGGAKAINSQFSDKYYDANGAESTPNVDGIIWYKGGGKDCVPQLVNRAKTLPCADIDGDGKGESYGAADLAALKNKLLKKQDYKYVYGDANKDGKINSGDLAALVRATAGDYNHIRDGFWRNLELGNFTIYYGENDNYDAARKLELYLEAASGVDIKKAVSANKTVSGINSDKTAVYVHANDIEEAPDGTLDIIVGNVGDYSTALTGNDYGVTYDKENGVLWIQGANFTGVEQAVLDFVNGSNINTNSIFTVDSKTLSPEKQPVSINGTTYYYTWGDEFDGTSLAEDNWSYSSNTTEGSDSQYASKYLNLETAFNEDIDKLFVVSDGKLSMKRGVYKTSAVNALGTQWDWNNGYGYVGLDPKTGANSAGGVVEEDDIYVDSSKIITDKSLLVKQGYFELKASLPSDGHAFPAWWMMGNARGGNNNANSESLFGKIYKLNPYYENENTIDGSNFKATYKYQYPNAYFEFDIIELMQDITNISKSADQGKKITGIYDYELTFNVHKYYNVGVVTTDKGGTNKYYPIDWANNKVMSGYENGLTINDLDKGSEPDWIKSYDGSKNGTAYTFGSNDSNFAYKTTEQTRLTAMRRYGFEWKVTDSGFSYKIYIYDANGDGDESDIVTFETTELEYNEAAKSGVKDPISDLEVANQYMYFLIDNKYYTTNQFYGQNAWGTGANPTNFTDLLTMENSLDKTCFDLEYFRVYQQAGKRDIVTGETEYFNNGNHFGY